MASSTTQGAASGRSTTSSRQGLDRRTGTGSITTGRRWTAAGRSINREAYLVGEIWHVAPDWVSGDRFDALMNYPLAEAIIGFVGGRSLNEPLLRTHHEYARVTRLDGPAFAARLGELLSDYDPATTAVQLNLLGSHDTPRVLSLLGGDVEAMELAVLLQGTLPGAPCVFYGDEVGITGG